MLMLAGILVLALQAHAILIVVMSKLAKQSQVFIQLRSKLHAAIETKGSDRMPSEHLMQPVIPSIFIAIGAVPALLDFLFRMHMLAGILMPAIPAYAVFIIVMRPRTLRSLLLMLLTVIFHAAFRAEHVREILAHFNMVSVVNRLKPSIAAPIMEFSSMGMHTGVMMTALLTIQIFIIAMALSGSKRLFPICQEFPTTAAVNMIQPDAANLML